MPDIRLVRPQGSRIWIWTGGLALIALLFWAAATFLGDPTDPAEQPRIGAAADFGADRAPVLPAQAVPFSAVTPIEMGDLGRLVHFTGTAESRVVSNAVWARHPEGWRILIRFEPPPPDGALADAGIRAGRIDVEGYLESLARAEFNVWADTLNISIPRPPPGTRFGQVPSPEFLRLDSLYIRDYYISVRPEGLQRRERGDQAARAGRR